MKKLVVTLSVLVVLALLAFGADRAVAAAAERTITDRVSQSFPTATSVSTDIVGSPVLLQVARGSLDHVRVVMAGVPAGEGLTLETVDVDLYAVSTSAPRTASTVEAQAHVSTATLKSALGDSWVVTPDGTSLVVTYSGGIPVEAHITPVVRGGKLALDLDSVSVLGISVDGSNIPSAITERITRLAGSFATLPLGLTLTSVTVTPTGVDLLAHGSDVALEGA